MQSEAFRNRHGYFSINVQAICDAKLRFQNVVVNRAGSAHDQTVFVNSNVYTKLTAGTFGNFVLIGDSGYANTAFLCTPFSRREKPNPGNFSAADHEYQRAIITTRNTVERAFGLLKRRFPILHSGMQFQRLDLIQRVITTCCILHNICINAGDTVVDDDLNIPPEAEPEEPVPALGRGRRAPYVRKARDIIVSIYEQRIANNIHMPTAEERQERHRQQI